MSNRWSQRTGYPLLRNLLFSSSSLLFNTAVHCSITVALRNFIYFPCTVVESNLFPKQWEEVCDIYTDTSTLSDMVSKSPSHQQNWIQGLVPYTHKFDCSTRNTDTAFTGVTEGLDGSWHTHTIPLRKPSWHVIIQHFKAWSTASKERTT